MSFISIVFLILIIIVYIIFGLIFAYYSGDIFDVDNILYDVVFWPIIIFFNIMLYIWFDVVGKLFKYILNRI